MLGLGELACAGASDPEAAEPEGEAWAGAVAAGREPPAHAPTKHETQTSKEEIRMINSGSRANHSPANWRLDYSLILGS